MSTGKATSSSTAPAAVRVGFYEIERTIGRGNFAVVKLARHRITKSQVCGLSIVEPLRLFDEDSKTLVPE